MLEEDEKISRSDRVRNEDVLRRVKEERNTLHAMKRREGSWIGHILRRNCLLKHVFFFQENVGEMGGRARRHKQLLNGLKENSRYRKLKEETLDSTGWRADFERDCGPVGSDGAAK